MARSARAAGRRSPGDSIVTGKQRKVPPHEFVLDALAGLGPTTRTMFGCLAVYVEDKIVLILRDRPDGADDNGVWLATTAEHHASLQHEFPRMRSIRLFARPVTHWQVLPVDAPDFEQSALHACALIRARDPRIGKVPKRRLPRSRQRPAKSRSKSRATASRPARSRK